MTSQKKVMKQDKEANIILKKKKKQKNAQRNVEIKIIQGKKYISFPFLLFFLLWKWRRKKKINMWCINF